jgi:hypothetical protein
MSNALLTTRGVQAFYGKIQALKGIDLDVKQGEIVTLIGSNGRANRPDDDDLRQPRARAASPLTAALPRCQPTIVRLGMPNRRKDVYSRA